MPHSIERPSASALSRHDLFLVAFITNMVESEFSTHTHTHAHTRRRAYFSVRAIKPSQRPPWEPRFLSRVCGNGQIRGSGRTFMRAKGCMGPRLGLHRPSAANRQGLKKVRRPTSRTANLAMRTASLASYLQKIATRFSLATHLRPERKVSILAGSIFGRGNNGIGRNSEGATNGSNGRRCPGRRTRTDRG
jgi:hypothetical protein